MKKPKSFEESMLRLEEIVEELDKGELSLDQSLKQYEEGIRSLRHCEAFWGSSLGSVLHLDSAEKPLFSENRARWMPTFHAQTPACD